jgi:lipopolysaccharide transport system ATP-binding protein
LNDSGESIEVASVGQSIRLQVKVNINEALPELVVGYLIKDRLGQPVFGTNTHHLRQPIYDLQANESRTFIFSFLANLGIGSYSVAVALHTTGTHVGKNYEWRDLAVVFNVVSSDENDFIGVAWLPPKLEIY